LKAKNNRGVGSHLAIALQKWAFAVPRARACLKNKKQKLPVTELLVRTKLAMPRETTESKLSKQSCCDVKTR